MSGVSFFGLALVSGSKLVLSLAVIRYLSHWWFLSYVEKLVFCILIDVARMIKISCISPHMRKLYGDSLRKEAGFLKVIKNVASQNARLLESRAGRHGPGIKRVAREVKGTFGKVYDETAEALEEFLAKCKPLCLLFLPKCSFIHQFPARPMISEVVQDTKILLQQSRERLVIT